MNGSDLTARQREILDYIVRTISERGYPPAVREIGQAVGLTSPSTVHTHLQNLEEKGYLRRDPTKPRAIEVRWGPEAGLMQERPGTRTLPVYGSIAAGPTSLAEQSVEGLLPVPREFIGEEPHFVLRVTGESMVGAGILPGDMAVVRSQPEASSGDIVVAQVTGPTGEAEATVKRLRRKGGRTWLVPENEAMQPFEAPPDTRIIGRVVALMRKF